MNESIDVIRAKRVNITLILFTLLLFAVIGVLFLNHALSRLESLVNGAREEYRPVVDKSIQVLSQSKESIAEVSKSGKNWLDAANPQNKKVAETLDSSINTMTKDYFATKSKIDVEYESLKKVFKDELNWLKTELTEFKDEIGAWRKMIFFFLSIFSTLMFLSSIKDIMENIRWFLAFYKKPNPESLLAD